MSSNEDNKMSYFALIPLLVSIGLMILWVLIILGAFFTSFGAPEQGEVIDMSKTDRSAVVERLKAIEVVNVKGQAKDMAAIDAKPAAETATEVTETPAEDTGVIDGNAIVTATCFACHSIGLLESPKIGDKAAWDKRLQALGDMDALVKSAIVGKGAMPPRGGNAGLSDAEVRAAVEFMMQ